MAHPSGDPAPAVTCTALRKVFGNTIAVDELTLTVQRGETLALLGPNGAGKTTALRILVTLLRADSGHATVMGHDVAREATAVRRVIGYVPQQLSVDGTLSGFENVWLFARLFDVPRRHLRARIAEVLRITGLEEAAQRPAATYSGGMVRRLELAQALVNRPQLLVLDEPTIGLDPVARTRLWDRISDLRDETGMTILLTTHYMEEAESQCDRVALMHRGRVRAEGTPHELRGQVGPEATLDDVFRHFTGDRLDESGSLRDVRSIRRTARRSS